MPQYLPGSEAFVNAVLERDKMKLFYPTLNYECRDNKYTFFLQISNNDVVYFMQSYESFNNNDSLNKRKSSIGQWRPKSFKPKYYETARTLESK